MMEPIESTLCELQHIMSLQELAAAFWYSVSVRPSSNKRSLLIGCRGNVMSFWSDLAFATSSMKPSNAIERPGNESAETFLENILNDYEFWAVRSRHDGLRDGADGVFVFVSASRKHVVQLRKAGECPELKQLTQYLESLVTAFD